MRPKNPYQAGLASLLLVCACGSEEPTVKEKLIGTWVVEFGVSAMTAYVFYENDTFELDILSFAEPVIRQEAYTGPFDLRESETSLSDDNGNYLFLQPTAGTCPGAWRIGYTIDFVGESVRLADRSGVTVLEPAPDGDGSPSVISTFGCFTEEGDFYPSQLQPLSGEAQRQTCEPGEVRACALAGQTCLAVQVCNAVGSAFAECACPG